MREGYNFQFRACAEYLWLWLAIDCHQDAHRCEFSIEGRSFSLQDRFMSVILTLMLASDSPLATHEKWAALLRRCFKRKGGKKKGLWHREKLDPTSGMIWDSSADWRLSMLFQEKRIAQFQSESCRPFAKKMSFIARFSALSLHFSLFAYVMTGWYTH